MKLRRALCLIVLISASRGLCVPSADGEERIERRAPGTIVLRGDPDRVAGHRIVPAFPRLRFRRPLYFGFLPDGSGRLCVLEQDGRVLLFPNADNVGPEQVHVALDIRQKVYRKHNEEGLLGIAFHPRFAENRTLFIHYSANGPRRGVVSRFRMNRARTKIDPRSERVVLEQRQPWGNHNGGGLEFGPDGYLYITFGDGGAGGDPQGNGQNLGTWLGSILRIDVDRKSPYAVPPDNPFVKHRGARPEIWAYGLRNVWRFSFDRLTGDLWAGDVGQNAWEEIDLIVKGGNYGWKIREGAHPFRGQGRTEGLIDPVIEFDTSQARSITGGYVYRGKKLPGLVGTYVYADYATGNVWGLKWDGETVRENRLLGRGRSVSSFGEDADGEVYFTSFDGRIYTFTRPRHANAGGRFPRKLSETGLFTDTAALTPHASLIPYEVNVPLWSDGAAKQRYVMLPGMERVRVGADGRFTFPQGTIFVKTFFAGTSAKAPRLETRLFARRDEGWRGYTYVWNEAQTDAELIDGRVTAPTSAQARRAGLADRWTFPSRSDCMSCHTEAGGSVLGFRAEQLHRTNEHFDEATVSRLEVLQRIGVFEEGADPRAVTSFPRWDDGKAPLDGRVRAYLDTNCASCHQPGAPGNARIDLRYDTPLGESRMLEEPPGDDDLGVPNARIVKPGRPNQSLLLLRMLRTDEKGMPHIAHESVDRKAVDLVTRWIRSLRPLK